MNRLFLFCVLLVVGAASARANIIIMLDDPSQTGTPGGTLSYTGVLSNTGLTTVFLNSANLNFAGSSFTPDFINPFFNNVPLFLDAGQFTASIELFSVLVNNPFLDPNGAYAGSYTLLGGIDSGSQDILASAVLTVNVGAAAVPEPNMLPVLAIVLVGLLAWRGRNSGETEGVAIGRPAEPVSAAGDIEEFVDCGAIGETGPSPGIRAPG